MKLLKFTKRDLIVLLFLILIVVGSNLIVFSAQLHYGFRDVDWMSLFYFKVYGSPTWSNILELLKLNGAYIHQVYYVGILEYFWGLNFQMLHLMSQMFKIMAGISLYFLTFYLFKNRLLAFLTVFLYTISYTHAGPLFQLATGSYFFAAIFLNIFFILYFFITKNRKTELKWLIIESFLLISILFMSTERMYPLIPLVLVFELISVLVSQDKKLAFRRSLRRGIVIFLPLIVLFVIYMVGFKDLVSSGYFAPQFFLELNVRVQKITEGNWQLILYPFASLGSIFLHGDFWNYFAKLDSSSMGSYMASLLFGPLLVLLIPTILIMYCVARKPLKAVVIVLFSTFIFGLFSYMVFKNWLLLDSTTRVNFDLDSIGKPALFGAYILFLNIAIFISWLKNRNKLLIPIFSGTAFAVLFIFLTWLASDVQLLFVGPQRYLSFPAMGTSLFISGILVVIFTSLRKFRLTKALAWVTFLLLFPMLIINYQVAHEFFRYELGYAGLDGSEQARMKNQFWKLSGIPKEKEPLLFYFDETQDTVNGYFDESTILAGFEFWSKFTPDGGQVSVNRDTNMLRTNVMCEIHTHLSCMKLLKSGYGVKDGIAGIFYKRPFSGDKQARFYPLSNFYAMRFVNKQLIDIRSEVLSQIKP